MRRGTAFGAGLFMGGRTALGQKLKMRALTLSLPYFGSLAMMFSAYALSMPTG